MQIAYSEIGTFGCKKIAAFNTRWLLLDKEHGQNSATPFGMVSVFAQFRGGAAIFPWVSLGAPPPKKKAHGTSFPIKKLSQKTPKNKKIR